MADFKALISLITGAVDKFNRQVPGIQKRMLDDVLLLTKQLEVKDGKIKMAAANLKVLSQIRGKLQKVLLSPEYTSSVKEYVGSFDEVMEKQHAYFREVEQKFKPPKLAQEIKKGAIESVVNSLTENGLNANVVDKIHDMMRKATTGGGSYSTLTSQLTDFILTNESGEGQLLKYTRQITTDALNQFSGQYAQVISADLGFEWYRYSGSNIETTRPFCLACTDRKYFHISELPRVLEGDFEEFREREGKINAKTKLPEGMIAGTDVSNFMTLRGGYNCGHQWRPVSEEQVPEDIQMRTYGTTAYRAWAAAHGKKVDPPATKEEPKKEEPKPTVKEKPKVEAKVPNASPEAQKRQEKIVEKNQEVLETFAKKGLDRHDELLLALDEEISFQTGQPDQAYYSPIGKTIVVGEMGDRLKSPYFKKTLLAHELGHAIHNTKGIIHLGQVSREFTQFFAGLKKIVKGKEDSITKAFWDKYKGASVDHQEQLVVIYDILGSLTNGKFGGGHPVSYYKKAGKSEAEIFAHAVSLLKVKNEFEELTPEVKEVIGKMREYVSKVL